ncbi:MAG TPA: carbohydrate porin [Thermoanaerobaculia bacterium]|nr:carbohydrate porin [Thermoanaerobaculia bacterium]
MRRTSTLMAGLLALVVALTAASVAVAQVTGLYYREEAKDGRIYVFNTPERFSSWSQSGDMGAAITLPGRGPGGETVVGENETAIDLYLFKHNLDAYDRPTPKGSAKADYPATKIGGRVYADFSDKENKDKQTGVKSGDSGVGVDVKRFYFTASHDFDKTWSALFQSDIGDQGTKRYDVFVKKAYLQAKVAPEATFRLGSADTPWIPFVESLYGFRYVEQTLTDHLSFGASADWGLHFLGKAGGDLVSYQFSAENGRGYSNPARSKSVDFEGRIGIEPIKGLNLAVGGYTGKRGLETDAAPAKHTASRSDALVAYVSDRFRVGGELFNAKNWNSVTTVPTDKSDGYSVWGSVGLTGPFTLFGRYDEAKPSKDLKPDLKLTYYNAGLQWRANKSFAGSLVYKFEEVKGGTFSTGNGTIGSVNALNKGQYNEIGIFAVYDF